MSRLNFLRPLLPIIGFFIILALYLRVFGPIPFNVNNLNTNKTDSFGVSGVGEVTQTPDQAILSIGVQSQGTTVKATQDSLNSSINSVTQAIKKQGITDQDIQTQNYTLNPSYDFGSGTQKITGYQANSTLKIKIHDLSKVNTIIDTATSSGANQVGNVSFEISDPSKLENEARDLAVAEAKLRAQTAAKAAGFQLGRLISYSENFGDNRNQPMPMIQNAVAKTDLATEIQPGTNTIKVEVFLNYEIN